MAPPTIHHQTTGRIIARGPADADGPLLLPKLQGALTDVLAAVEALEPLREQLGERIERNRLRSERYRHAHAGHNGNGHSDDRLVLGRNGLRVECRRCGRTLAVDATDGHPDMALVGLEQVGDEAFPFVADDPATSAFPDDGRLEVEA